MLQIGPANPRLQRVLDALDAIKTKVNPSVPQLTKQNLVEIKTNGVSDDYLPSRESRPPSLTLTQLVSSQHLWIIGPTMGR